MLFRSPQGKPPKGGTEATDWTDTAERGLATLLCDCVLPGRSIIRLDKSKDEFTYKRELMPLNIIEK